MTERLGLGPEDCFARNPRLVYGRVTGWGQEGPLAQAALHDLNYIALAGAVHAFGRHGQPPTPPLNLIGDFGGGALYLAFGVVCAFSRRSAGPGAGRRRGDGRRRGIADDEVLRMMAAGLGSHERGTNILDTGAHFYEVYECADGRWISVAAIVVILRRTIAPPRHRPTTMPPQMPGKHRPEAKARLAALFKTRTRRRMVRAARKNRFLLRPAPTTDEAPHHPHNKMRRTYVQIDGIVQRAPAPRFSRTFLICRSRPSRRVASTRPKRY